MNDAAQPPHRTEEPGKTSRAAARYADASETLLMERASRGDSSAFGELVRRNMRRAYRAALGLVGSPDDALDLSQDAFVRALKHAEKLDPKRPFYPWYYAILRRLCFNFLRDRKNRQRLLDERGAWLAEDLTGGGPGESPEGRLRREDARRIVARALAGLPETQREVLVLREFEELKYREIAELLEIPEGTVMSRLYTARRALADALEEEQ
ncbi:MAG: RNA polymerase sigma factor [Gemmatimonadota bacterium]